MKYLSWLIAVAAVLGLHNTGHAQPAISKLTPDAVAPGKTIELTFTGTKLADPLKLWTSFPASVEWQAANPEGTSRVCKVTLDAAAPVGLGGLVLGNAEGTSDPYLLLVDDLPSVAESGTNHSTAAAQGLTFPVAVDGTTDGPTFDYYKFAAKQGQRVAFEVVAARLGSSCDPVVRLLDAQGKELALADDDTSTGADCRLAHTFTADGEYVLELRDNRYASGGRYRLRLGDFPLIASAFPIGVRWHATTQLQFLDAHSDGALSAETIFTAPGPAPQDRLSTSVRLPNGQSSSWATLVLGPHPEFFEAEPNQQLDQATLVTIPCAVNGRLQVAGDQDLYRFAAAAGQTLQFKVTSRSVGSPSLPVLRVVNAQGGVVAESAIGEADEFSVSYKIPENGIYGLLVEDLLQRGGPVHTYRVELAAPAGFSLALKNDPKTPLKFLAGSEHGGFSVEVQVARNGYDGPIRVRTAEPVQGLTLHQTLIPEKAAAHKVLVSTEAGWQPGNLETLRLEGIPEGPALGQPVAAERVSTLALVKTKMPPLAYPPAFLDGLLTVAGTPPVAPFFQLNLPEQIVLSRAQGQVQLTWPLERKQAEFKDAVTILWEQLPSAVAAAVKVEGDQYQVTLTAPKEIPPGVHPIRVLAYGEHQGRGQFVQRLVSLQITE